MKIALQLGIAMKFNRKQKISLLLALLLACLSIQIIQGIYRSKWQSEWESLFTKASQIETEIDVLLAEGAEPQKIKTKIAALRNTMTDINNSFHPDLVPEWLQIVAGLGLVFTVIALFIITQAKETGQNIKTNSETSE